MVEIPISIKLLLRRQKNVGKKLAEFYYGRFRNIDTVRRIESFDDHMNEKRNNNDWVKGRKDGRKTNEKKQPSC